MNFNQILLSYYFLILYIILIKLFIKILTYYLITKKTVKGETITTQQYFNQNRLMHK